MECETILKTGGESALLEHLKQWDYGGESEHTVIDDYRDVIGMDDSGFISGEYVMTYNTDLKYCGLFRAVEHE